MRITIRVTNGVYPAKVGVYAWNPKISLVGEGYRSYFKDCTIEGSVDFIFGKGTARPISGLILIAEIFLRNTQPLGAKE